MCLRNSPNRNGEHLSKFSQKKHLLRLNKFQKKKGKTMALHLPKKLKSAASLYVDKKKSINGTENCNAHRFFKELSSKVELTSIQDSRLQPQSPPLYKSVTGRVPFPQAPAGAQRMAAIRLALVLWEIMLVMFSTYDQTK